MVNKSPFIQLNAQPAQKSAEISAKVASYATNPGLSCNRWRVMFPK